MTQCRARNRHQEFLGFLKHIEANVPSDLDLHLVVDNYAATNIRRSAHGWPKGLDSPRISRRPTHPG